MYDYEDVMRATGRTIRIKLRVILQMSENPGVWIQVQDHWYTAEASRNLLKWIEVFCASQGMTTEAKANNQGYFLRFIK